VRACLHVRVRACVPAMQHSRDPPGPEAGRIEPSVGLQS